MRFLSIMGITASIFITGCATNNGLDAVKNRASFDLNCPIDKISFQDLNNRSFGARGCGKRASYSTNRCWSGDYEGCTAHLDQVSDEK